MTKDFLNFLIIYAILIIMFSIVGNLLFIIEIPKHYGSLFESILTIFDASLGNYSFTVFEGKHISDRTEAIGKVYLFIVVLLFNILVLNLIIAILSNTFNMFEPKSKGLYLSKILSVRPTMSYDETYGSLLIGLPPFNAHLLPLLPYFLLSKDPSKLNHGLVFIQHLLLVVTYLVIFFGISLFLVPFAFLKALLFKFSLIVDGKNMKDMLQRALYGMIFLNMGIPLLVLSCFVDTFYEILHIYQKKLKKVILARNSENVSTETFRNLLQLCKEFLRKKVHAVYTKEFIKRFREDMKINQMM